MVGLNGGLLSIIEGFGCVKRHSLVYEREDQKLSFCFGASSWKDGVRGKERWEGCRVKKQVGPATSRENSCEPESV